MYCTRICLESKNLTFLFLFTHCLGFPGKFNPAMMLPSLPFPGLMAAQPNASKDFMQFYLEQLAAVSTPQTSLGNTNVAGKCIANRYAPYHR